MDGAEPNLEWTQIIAERKIREAMDAGEFDNLPGKGKPVEIDNDPFTPAHLRIANRVLKNARALPEWMQLEKDIEREVAGLLPARERALRALKAARNAQSRERIAQRLRDTTHENLDLINTLVLTYNYNAPATAQKPFRRFRLQAEMAELEVAIRAALGEAGE